MLEYFILLLAIPAGILCSYITNYEKNIWPDYFKISSIILAIVILVFFKNKAILFSSLAILIMILTWVLTTKWFDKK